MAHKSLLTSQRYSGEESTVETRPGYAGELWIASPDKCGREVYRQATGASRREGKLLNQLTPIIREIKTVEMHMRGPVWVSRKGLMESAFSSEEIEKNSSTSIIRFQINLLTTVVIGKQFRIPPPVDNSLHLSFRFCRGKL